jgi:hypothetical protein
MPMRTFTFLKKRKTLFAAVLVLIALVSSIITSKNGGDFDVFLDAARKLSKGENIYQPPFIKGLQYYYSVFFAMILIPFSSNFFMTEIIWSLLSYLWLYRALYLIISYLDFSSLSARQYRNWLGLTILLSLQFVMYNVAMVQVTIFLIWAILESLHWIEKGQTILGGVLLALAINIKIMPVLIIPYLFYRGYFKALTVLVVCFVGLLLLPSLVIGHDQNMFLHSEWWGIINPGHKEHLFETGIGLHSITAFLPVYLTETSGEMGYRRHLFNFTPQQVAMSIQVARLFIIALSLLYFRSLPFSKEHNRLKMYWEISFFMLIIPLLLPHQQKYAFLLAIPMVCYLLYFFIRTYSIPKSKLDRLVFAAFYCCMLVYSPLYGMDIIGKFLFTLTQHYRLLTICTLLLIPISVYCNPLRWINSETAH